MSNQEQFKIPTVTPEADSKGFDKSEVAVALRGTSDHINALFEEHGDLTPSEQDATPKEVGDRYNTSIQRTVNPETGSAAYEVSYTETVVPKQPIDTGEAGYDPYDFKVVSVKWRLGKYGDPVDITHNFDGPYAPEKEASATSSGKLVEGNTTKGSLIVEGFGDDRISGVLEDEETLDALKDVEATIASALEKGDLTLREVVPEQQSPTASAEQEAPQSEGRMARLAKFGRGILGRNK